MEIVHDQTYYDNAAFKLLTLLSQNMLAEFHTQIESLQQDAFKNANIQQIISMEQFFIEGRYNRVFECVGKLSINVAALINQLKLTIVEAAANTIQTAYNDLPIDYARKLLMTNSDDELNAVVKEHNWRIEGNKIVFEASAAEKKKGENMNAYQSVSDSLSLIKEIDELM
ncbi:26S proteasome non-ATPase regulatory subunit, putative [Entamoeba invadens IP1]|uniref:26S proteasome non-ATPase regulatory subunit, putative n=1 Tax=Entamoeba invadens IP1 TaxID=370355 RepID=A0A0A1U045_ENTIV|nr:26S proteasome non-ATPase regulatory subunit, putative [Entamoeba invadens IP1]ELP84263.1 26S proteasome non-ATPase regulatory subunit, putative [Entamoeba invadens IP1]|eukprot:XP_004183609.1 26S proteasome non-ATPase regulatory subunit, putative [Entamoeba invadens IP1]